MKSHNLTWNTVKNTLLDDIDMFEDPVYSSYIEKDKFIEIYHDILVELDGGDPFHYFTSYFEPSPINNSIYLFVNDEMRKDFYEYSLELNLVLPMEEIFEGESAKEKAIRENII